MSYFMFLGLVLLCALFSGWASMKVHSAYSTFDSVENQSRMTGYDTVVKLMKVNGINNLSVGRVRGKLSDHFDPRKNVVNLSESTYGSSSVAAVAVAAHEMGHVMQREESYFLYKMRAALVPLVNFGSGLALPVVIVGLLLDLFTNTSIGLYTAYVGIGLYGLSTLFHLVTLPVEIDASRRAKKMLLEEGIITEEEKNGASKVLDAAALTYVAGLLASLLYFLRFITVVLSWFGDRN